VGDEVQFMKRLLLTALVAAGATSVFRLVRRYRRDLRAARLRLAGVDRHAIATPWGVVEYAERGSGDPLLVVHGIYQNCASGLFSVRGLFPHRRVIAPSRFGYLGSTIPSKATVAAQADAFVSLLDALGISQIDVIGLSAGATSALQLALRHPERVKHLAVLVGNWPGSPTAVVQPSSAKRIDRQLVIWGLKTFVPLTTARLVAAVPKTFAMTNDDVQYVDEFIDSLFPMRRDGYNFDLYVSNAEVNAYNLEAIRVPTLIVHTKDDQLASHEASQRAAERIPGARFVSLESGGHLMLGQTNVVRDELADFFRERTDRGAEPVAS
jgi:pimeloyl-ACP methyl ester carboxylesterase